MLFILFCNFLLVLDGSGPPREIKSSTAFDSASAAGAGCRSAGKPQPWPCVQTVELCVCPPPPGEFLLLGLFQCNLVVLRVTDTNKRQCLQTLILLVACTCEKLQWLRGRLKAREVNSTLVCAHANPILQVV